MIERAVLIFITGHTVGCNACREARLMSIKCKNNETDCEPTRDDNRRSVWLNSGPIARSSWRALSTFPADAWRVEAARGVVRRGILSGKSGETAKSPARVVHLLS